MRRFLITSPAYTGEAEIIFDTDGRFIRLDVMNTNMSPLLILTFKEKVPAHINELQSAFEKTKVTIVETSIEITFEMFWIGYDKKINKKRCEPLWAKLSTSDRVAAYYGVKAYDKYLKKDTWRPKADPEKYLKDRYWENEWK